MKHKSLNLLLILTSFLGYLEWGKNNQLFLFEAEIDILSKIISDPLSVAHPFIIIPLAGQIILLVTLFQKIPGKKMTYIGIASLAVLLVFLFVIGIISMNLKISLSTIPFIITSVFTIKHMVRPKIKNK